MTGKLGGSPPTPPSGKGGYNSPSSIWAEDPRAGAGTGGTIGKGRGIWRRKVLEQQVHC